MKVIDLLNMIVKGEEVPKKVRVLDQTLLPEYQIITWNEDLNLYEYCDGCEFDRVLDKHHLEKYIEIIEDTPKEDKKIEKLDIGTIVDDELQGLIKSINLCNKEIQDKLNKIIDRLNGDSDE